MVIRLLCEMILTPLIGIISILPQIPQIPTELSTVIEDYLSLLFANGGLVGFFLPMTVVKIALPVSIIIANFDRIYRAGLWVLRKIPFINVK